MGWATGEDVQVIMEAAGLNYRPSSRQARAFATAAAFAAAGEDVVLAILRPPAIPRSEVGQARLLVVTSTRAIEVTGPMSGDWSASLPFADRGPAGGIAVVVRNLNEFTGFTLDAGGWQFLAEEGDGASSYVEGSSATLTGHDVEPLVLWDPSDAAHTYPRCSHADWLRFLHWIAGGRSSGQPMRREIEAS